MSDEWAQSLLPQVANGKVLAENIIGGGLLSPQLQQELKERGVELVVDTRTSEEGILQEQQLAHSQGVSYANLPISGSAISDEVVDAFARLMAQHQGKRTLFHCRSGRRVDLLWQEYQLWQRLL